MSNKKVQEFLDQESVLKEATANAELNGDDYGHHTPTKGKNNAIASHNLYYAITSILEHFRGSAIRTNASDDIRLTIGGVRYTAVVHQGDFDYYPERLEKKDFLIYSQKFPETPVYAIPMEDALDFFKYEATISKVKRTNANGYTNKLRLRTSAKWKVVLEDCDRFEELFDMDGGGVVDYITTNIL